MIENKKYLPEIDLCRGMGIVLVVLGHALKQTGVQNTCFNIMLSVIYSFHMPLFFFLSGFVSDRILSFSFWGERINYLKGRAFRLLIPYFSVGILYMPLKYYLSRYAVKPYDFTETWKIFLGDNPNTALWFLYILFLACTAAVILVRSNNLNLLLGFSFLLMTIAYGMDWMLRLPKYLFFFILGIYIRKNYNKWKNTLANNTFFLGALFIFVVMNILLHKNAMTAVMPAAALSGIVCCMYTAVKISRNNGKICSLIGLMGRYSMDIYILSEPFNTAVKIMFWSFLGLNYLVCTILCFAAALILPMPVSKYIVRKVKVLRVLFLGSK